ncbi:TRAP transporter 4TM/12TM fusion protein [Roseinatronobacter thiooxidans]|uniref:TRAP transporter 4TM/12TM fusion protein n=1 Tax=Roseinatronobacter thiooxidans TaxID=121821 RepID=A0A2W7QD75_9RHOB|nr:TRAP transporter permease [Roseinatronobacter thiooxidans]PZX42047.1 TRAP transporter 4TM/12TM fusion protein [Roseinatronobacter thiooxidans]
MVTPEKSVSVSPTTPDVASALPDASMRERPFSSVAAMVITVISAGYVLFHLYVLNVKPIDPWIFRSVHLSVGSAIAFIIYSGWRGAVRPNILDLAFAVAALWCTYYLYQNLSGLYFRVGALPNQNDVIFATVGIFLVLEFTRRTSGIILPILALIFIGYGLFGNMLPGVLEHRGYSYSRLISYLYGNEGVFGVILAASSTYLVLFIVFAAFLQVSGVGNYFVQLAFAMAGRARGGPAKVAVIASGLMGMINGTSAGNAVATGSLTIPLMKRVGYSPRFAAAVEATASTGGQFLPPIMGAGAFIMAEVTGIPYTQIVIAATIPALLYFFSVYLMVDKEALKQGLVGLPRSELPNLRELVTSIYLLAPILILIILLMSGYSIIRSGTLAMVAVVVTTWFSTRARMSPKVILNALSMGGRMSLQLVAVCACAGIIVGVISLTGLGGRFSYILFSIAQENQLAALLAAMFISIILGMGMPTTAAYAVAASVVAPGLVRTGMDPLLAHLFVFYFSVMSAITPPIALAAFATSGIAGSPPMRTSVEAFKIGLAAFIVPFAFVYSPALIMVGDPLVIAFSIVTAMAGIFLLASAVQGWLLVRAGIAVRIATFIAALLLISGDLLLDTAGLALVAIAYLYQFRLQRAAAAAPPPAV